MIKGNLYFAGRGNKILKLLEIRYYLRRNIISMSALLPLLLVPGTSYAAFAGSIEIQSVHISPAETAVEKHPEITGTLKTDSAREPGEALIVNVVATVTRPDNLVKSWVWKSVKMQSGETRHFNIPKEYEIHLAGSYKVDFNVYTKDMRPLRRLSKTFVAFDPMHPPEKTITQDSVTPVRAMTAGREHGQPAEYQHLGIGIYANTLNPAGGATVLLWPFKYLGLQSSYAAGSFTTTEGRILARFPLNSGISPYVGAGYLNVAADREIDVLGITTTFRDGGVSGVVGVEMPLSKRVSAYVEISGAKIDLKEEVAGGGLTGTASVKYSPTTVGLSIVYFAF